jgi:hypothetical protein
MGIRIASYCPPAMGASILNVCFHMMLASGSKVLGCNAIPHMLRAAPSGAAANDVGGTSFRPCGCALRLDW